MSDFYCVEELKSFELQSDRCKQLMGTWYNQVNVTVVINLLLSN